ncbi:MAG: endonuclease domain-containing protein [Chryseolinea sp.]
MSKGELHCGARPRLFEYARMNRKPMTPAERKLWNCLKNRKLNGSKFRRQHPIADYIVDFFCLESKLAIEIDGLYHNDPQQLKYDQDRSVVLTEFGIRTVRFTNTEIDEHLDKVLDQIKRNLAKP